MSHERNRGKIFFSLEKVFQKLENVTLSVFNNCMLAPNTENSIKRYFLIYLRPLNSVSNPNAGNGTAHANRLGEYICMLYVPS